MKRTLFPCVPVSLHACRFLSPLQLLLHQFLSTSICNLHPQFPAHRCSRLLLAMVALDPGNIRLQNAIEATAAMNLRDLPKHICVGPMPAGTITVSELPLKELDPNSSNLKHFMDLVLDISSATIDCDQIKAIVRDRARHELPTCMQMKSRPSFEYISQCFLLSQSDANICLLKHVISYPTR